MNNLYFEGKCGLQLTDVTHKDVKYIDEYLRNQFISEYHYNVNCNFKNDKKFQNAFDDLMWLSNLRLFRIFHIHPSIINIQENSHTIVSKSYIGLNEKYIFNFT